MKIREEPVRQQAVCKTAEKVAKHFPDKDIHEVKETRSAISQAMAALVEFGPMCAGGIAEKIGMSRSAVEQAVRKHLSGKGCGDPTMPIFVAGVLQVSPGHCARVYSVTESPSLRSACRESDAESNWPALFADIDETIDRYRRAHSVLQGNPFAGLLIYGDAVCAVAREARK